jgi:hypothetical protein
MTAAQAPDVPAVGSQVSLMRTTAPANVSRAVVRSWDRSDSGLVVTARVAMNPQAAAPLDRLTVWVSARTARSSSLVVLSAVVRAAPEAPGELVLTGIADLALEARREAVRARFERPALLVAAGGQQPARALDLSRTGCRMALDGDPVAELGAAVEVRMELRDRLPLRAAAHVLRVDPEGGELIVHFDRLSADDAQRVDYEVFSTLTGRG